MYCEECLALDLNITAAKCLDIEMRQDIIWKLYSLHICGTDAENCSMKLPNFRIRVVDETIHWCFVYVPGFCIIIIQDMEIIHNDLKYTRPS